MTKLLNPQQLACWENYSNPHSETFGNERQSALRAGYGVDYSDKVGEYKWFQRLLEKHNLRRKGERVLNEMLDMPVKVETRRVGAADEEVAVVKTDPALVKIKQDTAKFVVERLGKDEWSSRQELTGAEGAPLVSSELKQEADAAITEYLESPVVPELPGAVTG